jgi:rRNA pseudouridine-1189 N-methylase Emg1 (Nep1/Mra1 family)
LPTHIDGMYVCVLGIPKGKFSKQMKKKKLSYRIIRIKHSYNMIVSIQYKSYDNVHIVMSTILFDGW